MRKVLPFIGCFVSVSGAFAQPLLPAEKPNIVIVYADDLGYGDIGVNGAQGVKTPNIDRLASAGVNFTDAHCSSATCTPSRYSLLTGSYAFRGQAAVLPGDAPLLIRPEQATLPRMLQASGYTTAVVGKWHLGLGNGKLDWNKEIKPGPREIGFDYSFLIPATGDRVPCVFVENQRVVGLDPTDSIRVNYRVKLDGYPTGTEHPELLKQAADPQHNNTIVNGLSRIGFMSGGEQALWKDEEFPFILTEKAKTFMEENQHKPFFLYLAFHDIHVPRAPNEQFVGTSSMGPRGDAIAQMDWCVGQVIEQLERLGLDEKTLVIFSSDNGPVLNDGYADQAVELLGDHQPSGPFRGGKYSILEAGTRMPTIVYWPGTVQAGTSSALLSQVDWYASLADLVGHQLQPGEAPDSQPLLQAWLGKTSAGRDVMLEEAYTYGLRQGSWKYIQARKGEAPRWIEQGKGIASGMANYPQLYNLEADTAEQNNLAESYPELVQQMQQTLEKILDERPAENPGK
ncbi:arylsulfatase [Mangrovibacterium marinum]|uniref:Arylsulfatase A-like enzyme n=1 Tax=Mangrovibacterium marinum TaxID=1639118 RepID=A0A2T5BXX8_9BACT|nr:arylsulfatase [Mangrovibacterium marinum]PTN06302.1 arylsulfatase A-like enzyme [Mangrovibacterium marinum]